MGRTLTGGQSVTIPHHSDLNIAAGDFTYALWLWLDNMSEFGTIFFKSGPELSLYHDNGGGNWGFGIGGNFSFRAPSPNLSTGSWNHVAVRRASTTAVTVWFNGTNVVSWSDGGSTTGTGDLVFGPAAGGGDDFDGRVAEFAMWNTPLDQVEIEALARGQPPDAFRHANLRLYFPFWGNAVERSSWRDHTASVSGATKSASHPRVFDFAGLLGDSYVVGSGPIEQAIGQVAETDTAQALGQLKTVTLGQVTETNSARALTAVKTLAIGQVSETDLSRSLSFFKTLALGQVSESDSARAITAVKTLTLGQVTEEDTAFGIGVGAQIVPIGQVEETDEAQSLTVVKTRELGRVTELCIVRQMAPSGGAGSSGIGWLPMMDGW